MWGVCVDASDEEQDASCVVLRDGQFDHLTGQYQRQFTTFAVLDAGLVTFYFLSLGYVWNRIILK